MNFSTLDDIDNKIVGLLSENARMSYTEIGESVGLSRVAVKNRIDNLENAGIIKGYRAVIDMLKFPNTELFYILIETKTENYKAVTDRLKGEKCVIQLFNISGNNAIMAICRAESKQERNSFAHRVREFYDGVNYFITKDIWAVEKGNIIPTLTEGEE